jgi:hypothetical protein
VSTEIVGATTLSWSNTASSCTWYGATMMRSGSSAATASTLMPSGVTSAGSVISRSSSGTQGMASSYVAGSPATAMGMAPSAWRSSPIGVHSATIRSGSCSIVTSPYSDWTVWG